MKFSDVSAGAKVVIASDVDVRLLKDIVAIEVVVVE
jgi:hypothetical protein